MYTVKSCRETVSFALCKDGKNNFVVLRGFVETCFHIKARMCSICSVWYSTPMLDSYKSPQYRILWIPLFNNVFVFWVVDRVCCHSYWFGLALLPLSLACHVVCKNINRMPSIDLVLIMSHISTEEKLFCNNYHFKSRSLNYEVTFSCWWF